MVPNGSAIGPPDPKSLSVLSRTGALAGLKKSVAWREPLDWTLTLTTASPRVLGVELPPFPGGGETPLPVAK